MKKAIIFGVLGVMLVGSLIIGTSYSLKVEDENKLIAECLFVEFKDNDEVSLNKDDNLKTNTFVVKNTCSYDKKFTINFETLSESNVDNDFVKLIVDANDEKVLNNYEIAKISISDSLGARKIASGWISAGTDVSYTIKVGLTDKAINSDINNLTYTGKLIVVSE